MEFPHADAGMEDWPGAGRRQCRDHQAGRTDQPDGAPDCATGARGRAAEGILPVLPGDGPTTGEPIGRHPDIDMVSFTGSTETGRRFLHYAAESNLKKVVLECGGKNPAIVMQDAEHLDQVAAHIANGAFWNMGQNCSAISRLIVHEDIHDALLEKLIAHTREWRQGNPLDPANRLGVLIDDEHFGKVSTAIETAKKEGMTPVIGGDSPDGKSISPTIFDNVDPASSLARDEVFGPVLAVMPVRSADQALQLANDTHYGLAASVFSKSLGPALRTARDLKAGTVAIAGTAKVISRHPSAATAIRFWRARQQPRRP